MLVVWVIKPAMSTFYWLHVACETINIHILVIMPAMSALFWLSVWYASNIYVVLVLWVTMPVSQLWFSETMPAMSTSQWLCLECLLLGDCASNVHVVLVVLVTMPAICLVVWVTMPAISTVCWGSVLGHLASRSSGLPLSVKRRA